MNIDANNPNLKSFIPVDRDSHFPIQNLPFGIFVPHSENNIPRAGVAIGDCVIDLAELERAGFFKEIFTEKNIFNQSSLNPFLELGKAVWTKVRNKISQLLRYDEPTLRDDVALRKMVFYSKHDITMLLPIKVSGYTDFYSSKEHATNLGKLFRPNENPLTPNWLHVPIGYDGRANSVVVSNTNFHRPCGQIRHGNDGDPQYSASKALDTEIEVAFIVGTPSKLGNPINIQNALSHIFGMVLLSDWSARDIQRWEYIPLGPFLGKNFCTSISPWIVTMDALEPFRTKSCTQNPKPLSYLQSSREYAYDIHLELSIKSAEMPEEYCISTTNYKGVYWDICQQLAHHSVNGCPMNTGDILASGTISGTHPQSYGSMVELTWGGKNPIKLPNGEERTFIKDNDTVSIKGWCNGHNYKVGFGNVTATILPALY